MPVHTVAYNADRVNQQDPADHHCCEHLMAGILARHGHQTHHHPRKTVQDAPQRQFPPRCSFSDVTRRPVQPSRRTLSSSLTSTTRPNQHASGTHAAAMRDMRLCRRRPCQRAEDARAAQDRPPVGPRAWPELQVPRAVPQFVAVTEVCIAVGPPVVHGRPVLM